MYTAIRGIYENGNLTLVEPAPINDKADVLITFLTERNQVIKNNRVPGSLKRLGDLEGKVYKIPDDFNEPIDDLKEYM